MNLDDDFWVMSMVTKGWWSVACSVLFILAALYQCQDRKVCDRRGGVYVEDRCLNKDALNEPP